MDKILIKPTSLRNTAQIFRQKSKVIRVALDDVEKTIKTLSSQFSGFRAASVISRYDRARTQLLESASIIVNFASALEITANTFEKADNSSEKVIAPVDDTKQVANPSERPVARDNGTDLTKTYDGKTYAKGTYNSKDSYSARPVNPPVTNTVGNRSVNNYQAVLNEFGVETNPRYLQRNGNTYCNIFVWDASKAMGAEIPHWVNSSGDAVEVGKGSELSANGVVNWLNNHGSQNGWHEISAVEAQSMANEGKPTVAVWGNPRGIGHVAMVRPGDYGSNTGPLISQAGGVNTNTGSVSQNFSTAWKKNQMQYFAHD